MLQRQARPADPGAVSLSFLDLANPDDLSSAARSFLAELSEMLRHYQPQHLAAERSSVEAKSGELTVHLAHAADARFDIVVYSDPGNLSVWVGDAHHDFTPDDRRPWTAVAVDFIAEVLRGDVRVEAAFRADEIVSTRLWVHDEDTDQLVSLGYVGFLSPARFKLWQRRRVERYTVPNWDILR